MRRKYAVVLGVLIIAAIVAAGIWYSYARGAVFSKATASSARGLTYAYVDLEHVVMSHPRYSTYHRLEMEYNSLLAQYRFEQWNYSRQASLADKALDKFALTDGLAGAALDQELRAKVAIKQTELNDRLQRRYEELMKAHRKNGPLLTEEENLRVVNLQLKLQTASLTAAERQAVQAELQGLLQKSDKTSADAAVPEDVTTAMAAEKEKAAAELTAYAEDVKKELQQRRDDGHELFAAQMGALGERPDPSVWNNEWKEKLEAKEGEMKAEKEAIMTDIREKAAAVAEEQGIDMVFSEYLGTGTALDITDDIIARLA